jgi:hypothetical protein
MERNAMQAATSAGNHQHGRQLLRETQKDRAYWLETMLLNWARWMSAPELPEGMPDKACGGAQNYSTYDANSESAHDKLDVTLAEATNAAIDALETLQQMAIYRAYGVIAVFRYQSELAYAKALELAKIAIADNLERRGIWLGS